MRTHSGVHGLAHEHRCTRTLSPCHVGHSHSVTWGSGAVQRQPGAGDGLSGRAHVALAVRVGRPPQGQLLHQRSLARAVARILVRLRLDS
eukprot:2620492-Rhodomonas_salina.1